MNELQKESSPYLLQHAANPIHWKAWNKQSLETALESDKLIVVSIGYSTCHWCHVMEHESFENQEVADLMNSHFISIKIDREEFPDIDAHYMKAIQIMTKQGGWPLNVVCLPDGRPIWGGTYFPKNTWTSSLAQLHQLYQSKRETAIDFAAKLEEGITILGYAPQLNSEARFNLDILIDKWSKSFDYEFGGYTRAPKFMMPTNLLYLQLHGQINQNHDILKYVDTTLTKMAWGGIFDTVEGGFSRYSVDFKWHVPHFEKMLYDNGQLLSVYANAYKRTKNPSYKEVIEKTISFASNNWSNTEGAYYSALDADSLNTNEKLEEGAFYVWTQQELKQLLQNDFDLFSQVFNINKEGYWEEGNYVLFQNKPLVQLAIDNKIDHNELIKKKKVWEHILLLERNERAKPRLDNKVIASWNLMFVIGLLDAYSALNNPEYLKQATNIITFVQQKLWCEEKGLYRIYNSTNTNHILGCLEDYAYYIQALITLFEHTGNTQYITDAKNVLDYSFDLFFDQSSGFFYYSQSNSNTISKQIEVEDNVIPSSNALMALNLIKLGLLYENQYYTKVAKNMTKIVLSQVDFGSAYSHWLLVNTYIEQPIELSIVGIQALHDTTEIKAQCSTHTFVIPVIEQSTIPYLAKYTPNNSTQFYLCKNQSCLAPMDKSSFLQFNELK